MEHEPQPRFFCHSCDRETLKMRFKYACEMCGSEAIQEVVVEPDARPRYNWRGWQGDLTAEERQRQNEEDDRSAFREAVNRQLERTYHSVGRLYSHPENYVRNQAMFERLMEEIFSGDEHGGPPPATAATISQIPTTSITKSQIDEKLECPICKEEMELYEEAKMLRCMHVYHVPCITTWLQRHATCPVCRKDLSGNDLSTKDFMSPMLPQ